MTSPRPPLLETRHQIGEPAATGAPPWPASMPITACSSAGLDLHARWLPPPWPPWPVRQITRIEKTRVRLPVGMMKWERRKVGIGGAARDHHSTRRRVEPAARELRSSTVSARSAGVQGCRDNGVNPTGAPRMESSASAAAFGAAERAHGARIARLQRQRLRIAQAEHEPLFIAAAGSTGCRHSPSRSTDAICGTRGMPACSAERRHRHRLPVRTFLCAFAGRRITERFADQRLDRRQSPSRQASSPAHPCVRWPAWTASVTAIAASSHRETSADRRPCTRTSDSAGPGSHATVAHSRRRGRSTAPVHRPLQAQHLVQQHGARRLRRQHDPTPAAWPIGRERGVIGRQRQVSTAAGTVPAPSGNTRSRAEPRRQPQPGLDGQRRGRAPRRRQACQRIAHAAWCGATRCQRRGEPGKLRELRFGEDEEPPTSAVPSSWLRRSPPRRPSKAWPWWMAHSASSLIGNSAAAGTRKSASATAARRAGCVLPAAPAAAARASRARRPGGQRAAASPIPR